MYEISVAATYPSPPERVFDVVSDHERFLTAGSVSCRLVHEGAPDRNGLGAVRVVQAGPVAFEEEILAFDAPRRFDYQIRSIRAWGVVPLPVHHERGWLVIEPCDEGTLVQWRSRFSLPVPLVGSRLETRVGARFSAAFRRFLERARPALSDGAGVGGSSPRGAPPSAAPRST